MPSEQKSSDDEIWDGLLQSWPVETAASRVDWRRGSFREQLAFEEDDARFIAAFCTRRAAKSYSGGKKAYRVALKRKCNVLIAGLHRDEVKRIWWWPIIRDIADRYGVEGCRFNETELSVRLPNGSWIYLLGMDADEKQKRKALGQKYALVLIDEAQDWVTDLFELVYGVLKPALADQRGAVGLLGTPGLVARGLFYDVTTGKEPGWTLHSWDTYANTSQPDPNLPRICDQWDAEIRDLIARKPGIEATPTFRRNYRKEWVVDESALVYRYQEGRNDFSALPAYRRGEWHHVLGCDLGWNATALSVVAYHDHDPTLYVRRSYRRMGLDLTATAEQAKALDREYQFERWMVDGAAKQSVEEMKRRQDCPWVAADKMGKAEFIELMNTEMLLGRIRADPATCGDLVRTKEEARALGADAEEGEWRTLIWDMVKLKETGKKEEKSGLPNHCCDATLYAWRECYPYLSTAHPPAALPPGSPEWHAQNRETAAAEGGRVEAEMLERAEQMEAQRRAEMEENGWL